MTIKNAPASVAVKDIGASVQWYEKVLGRLADSTHIPGLAEWKFHFGGWLQVYALPERAGSCSCTLTVSDIDLEIARLTKLGVATGAPMGEAIKVFMVKDLERWLADRDFIAINDFGVADILMTHVLESGIKDERLIAPYPGVVSYRDRCLARPAWKRIIEAYCARVEAG